MRRPLAAAIAVNAAWAIAFASPTPSAGQATFDIDSMLQRCQALTGEVIGGARVESASYVATGDKLPLLNIPAKAGFCKVRAIASGAPGSRIAIEIWLPQEWNGKMLGLGGSGFSGGLVTAALTFPKPVGQGYATLATDAGHQVTEPPDWALGQLERVVDFGSRANHLGARFGKAAIVRYYSVPPRRRYFQGCSNGGRDALMLAERHPRDYNGIIAGAPASNFVSLMTNFANYRSLLEKLPADSLTPKLGMLHQAALMACDANDGVRDGIIADPRTCSFNPESLACLPGQDAKTCLTSGEVSVVRTLYEGSRTRSGQLVHPGLAVGSEYLWSEWWTKPKSTGGSFAPYFFGYFVYNNPNWSMSSFNLDKDWGAAMRKLSPILDATKADLRPFVRAGGKLIMYQGWDDQAVSAYGTISYYESAKERLGRLSGDARLYMVPGMGHCFDGKGFTSAEFVAALDSWIETGNAPDQIVAERPSNPLFALAGLPSRPLMTRPLCNWPKSARYDGIGPIDQAGSYSCR